MSSENGDSTENVKIFSTEDEKIKAFGELLTNDSSRSIFQILMKDDATAQHLSQKTGLSIPLVLYHLNKMLALDVIKVSRTEIGPRGHEMKYYIATKFAIVILPESMSDKARRSRSLIRSLQSLGRLGGIAAAGVAAWFGSTSLLGGQNMQLVGRDADQGQDAAEPSLPAEQDPVSEPSPESSVFESSDSGGRTLEEAATISSKTSTGTLEEPTGQDAESASGSQFGFEASEPSVIVPQDAPGEEMSGPGGGLAALEAEDAAPAPDVPLELPAEGVPQASAGMDDLLVPVLVTVAVLGVGLLLEILYRLRTRRGNAARQEVSR